MLTPRSTENRPGLSALHYRIGSHGSFLQTMKAQLSAHLIDGVATRALSGLRVRDGGDPAIALLDAWASVGDVLTFYQERIANEGYLRTATEMRSLFELSRLVGYAPRPGVAASAYLAYTIDANTRQEIVITKGSRAQTVPGQDEVPQSFETSEDLKARAAWNHLGLRKTEPQQWATIKEEQRLILAGTQTRLKAGDPLLIGHEGALVPPEVYAVVSVSVDTTLDHTEVQIWPWGKPFKPTGQSRSVVELLAAAPNGKSAADVGAALGGLTHVVGDEVLRRAALDDLRQRVSELRAANEKHNAPRLNPWLADVAQSLDAARDDALAVAFITGGPIPIQTRMTQLVLPPSKPLSNALQLPRSLTSNFAKEGDVALRALGAAAPGLKGALAPALAGFQDPSLAQTVQVWAPRLRAGLFGRSFPRQMKSHTDYGPGDNSQTTSMVDAGEWPTFEAVNDTGIAAKESADTVCLDASHDGIAPGTWVFVDASAVDKTAPSGNYPTFAPAQLQPLVAKVTAVQAKVSRADYGGSGDTTTVQLGTPWLKINITDKSLGADNPAQRGLNFQVIRRTVVYALSEPLALAESPIERPFGVKATSGGTARTDQPIELDGLYADLEAGRFVIVSGERTDVDQTRGIMASEPVMITSVVHDVRAAGANAVSWSQQPGTSKLLGDSVHTFITIDKPLAYSYRRDSVVILGNVVKATHGETRNETLGSGDGAKALQSFDLKQSPLTWLPAATAAGAHNTLNVYVNDVRWREVDTFVGLGASDHVYLVATDDLGKTTVQFGDGREGSRPPTGIGNVKAVYRSGIGRQGNVVPDQIRQLASRPLGVNEVRNPLRSSGGADRESVDQIRRNAPLAVKSLDRLVSTPDYADFACTYAGIAKADAQEI
ncbi:MAG TPA: hypothetical protein VLJ62_30900, partial [Burkholderiaceae bacterium]|nr:hypothetical protein [Burkholderiaceae bacterium]